jgi:hypothetical protein
MQLVSAALVLKAISSNIVLSAEMGVYANSLHDIARSSIECAVHNASHVRIVQEVFLRTHLPLAAAALLTTIHPQRPRHMITRRQRAPLPP